MTTTCQICAREIKAGTGQIAHHGYRRPYYLSGTQTSSCYGARHVPYEVGHSALDAYVRLLARLYLRSRRAARELRADPPSELEWTRKDAWGQMTQRLTLARPTVLREFNRFKPATYEYVYWNRLSNLDQEIRSLRSDMRALRTRRLEWKAPA